MTAPILVLALAFAQQMPPAVAPLDDPKSFPLAVWLQEPKNAPSYAALGINTYVALWKGPTPEQLDELERCGMRVICAQNEVGLANKQRAVIAGWMHGDEPDNAQELGDGKGYGPPIAPEKIVADYQRMRAADPTRPVLLNLGQGVAWDGWWGRGVRSGHPEDYAEYVRGCDIASFDIYPVVHPREEVRGKLEFVARGVERLLDACERKKPVWACIETTHIGDPDRMATPAQMRSEVWMALVSGASGILYFSHEFKPKFIEAGLLAHDEMAQAVKVLNAEITALAPVLHEPTAEGAARATSSRKDVPIALMCKRHGDALYLFAVSLRGEATQAKLTVTGLSGRKTVEVLGEARKLTADGGRFSDAFDGYAVHAYRIE